jgi:hypothetical protein
MSVSVLGEEIAVVLGVLDGIPVMMSISHTCCSDWLSRWRDAKVKVIAFGVRDIWLQPDRRSHVHAMDS